jgi:hypothetical protein
MKHSLRILIYGLLASIAMAQPNPITASVSYTWAGLSPTWPGYDYRFVCSDSCVVSGRRWLSRSNTGRKQEATCRQLNRTIEARASLEALAQAAEANLEAVAGPEEYVHTDDYPRFKATLRVGAQTLVLLSEANSKTPPWNVQKNGQWFVQRSGELEAAFSALVKLVPCEAKP